MRFNLEGLEVFFPYDFLYQEQYDYMLCLKRAIDDKGHVLLEMPTGTGKTVCLISLVTSYQYQFPKTGKLIYCTRTVVEMTKCMEEIKRVINYRTSVLGPEGGKVLAVCLSSRRNMCIHPVVTEQGNREAVDNLCRSKTAEWVREKAQNGLGGQEQLCEFYEGFSSTGQESDIPRGVYSLDDLKALGSSKGYCPYFLTRYYINHATIVVFNYQYMLDPKVSSLVSRELEAESIVVFDEAHNIDNVCIEALSVTLNKRLLDSATRGVNKLQSKVAEMKVSNGQRLTDEYQELVRGLQNAATGESVVREGAEAVTTDGNATGSSSSSSSNSSVVPVARVPAPVPGAPVRRAGEAAGGRGFGGRRGGRKTIVNNANQHTYAAPVLAADLPSEAVPGNIRKAEHFVAFLKKIVVYLKTLLSMKEVENKTPLAFLHDFFVMTGIERKPLRFTYSRLNSLLYTLEVTNIEEFDGLQQIANFVTIVSTYLEGFAVILDPKGTITTGVFEPLVELTCMNASIAIKPVLEKYQSVVITSGTLSPIYLYPRLLALDSYNSVTRSIRPIIRQCLPMSIFRPCLLPLIVTRGSDQISVSTRFEVREDIAVIRNYGQLLIDVASVTPDGICCFFTSYSYMEYVLTQWDKMKIISQVMKHKLIFIETKDVVSTTLALDNYKRACDSGRGAVFLSIARGKVAEGVDFDRHYGRCVILFGIPYQYTLSYTLRARLNFMRDAYDIKDNDFLTFDALRQASQCIGRVIRSKTDYGVVILADARYNRMDKRSKFPPWVTQFIRESSLNLSTDVAVDQIKKFLRQMGQPINQDDLHGILLNDDQVKKLGPSNRNSYADSAATQETAQLNNVATGMDVSKEAETGVDREAEEPDLSGAEMSALYGVTDEAVSDTSASGTEIVSSTNSTSSEALNELLESLKLRSVKLAAHVQQRRFPDVGSVNIRIGDATGSLKRKSVDSGNSSNNKFHEMYMFEDIL